MNARWLEATRSLSRQERGLLVDLVLMAALRESSKLPITVEMIESMAHDEGERTCIVGVFGELCRLQLIREMMPGVFEIAPGLWRLADADGTGDPA